MEKQVGIAAEQVYAGWNEDIDYNSLWHHSIGKSRTEVSDQHGKLNFNYDIAGGCLRQACQLRSMRFPIQFPFTGIRSQVPQGEALRNNSRDSQGYIQKARR